MRSSEEKAYLEGSIPIERPLRSLPPTYSPSLVFYHGKKYRDQTFCTLSDGCYHVRSVPEMRQMMCIASSHGWLVMLPICKSSTQYCYLFNPISMKTIHLPPSTDYTFNIGVLTSSPSEPNCVVMLVSSTKNSCIFCRPGDNRWIEQDLEPKNKKKKLIKHGIRGAISCKGKIFLVFSKDIVVVIDVHDSFASIKIHTVELPYAFMYRIFCVESCGDIFLVRGLYLGLLTDMIQTLDVFKLDCFKMVWVKVESIGDRVFFVGPSSISLSATESGLKGNSIYLFQSNYTSPIYRFNMDDGSIRVTLSCPIVFPEWHGPFWVVTNCKVQVKQEVGKVVGAKNEEVYNEKGSWNDLPTELLDLILSSVFLGDCLRFRLTCKAWMSITPPLRTKPSLRQSESEYQYLPWLLYLPNKNHGECNFNHPIYNDAYLIDIPELAGAIILHANYGWLLMTSGNKTIFFLNPLTMETIKLPDLKYGHAFVGISFSSSPTSSDCKVFGHHLSFPKFVEMSVYRKGEDTWCTYLIESEANTFFASHCNPVFFEGVFYCLGQDGKLGVFNPKEGIEEELVWKVLPNLKAPVISIGFSYIVECDGELLSVFTGRMGNPIYVFKLDSLKKKWIRLESLGDNVLFLSNATSMLVPAGLKGIENRIYFPKFNEKDSLFYSLPTGSYHSFGSNDSRKDWFNTWTHWNCTWILANSSKEEVDTL